ncbi:hypothetical protein MRX96_053265 [Rhipicephalus microplus]
MPQQITMEGGRRHRGGITRKRMVLRSKKDGKNRVRNHTKPASRERNEARKRRLTLLYDASQLRACCRRCHVVPMESLCDREATSTCPTAARTGLSSH